MYAVHITSKQLFFDNVSVIINKLCRRSYRTSKNIFILCILNCNNTIKLRPSSTFLPHTTNFVRNKSSSDVRPLQDTKKKSRYWIVFFSGNWGHSCQFRRMRREVIRFVRECWKMTCLTTYEGITSSQTLGNKRFDLFYDRVQRSSTRPEVANHPGWRRKANK